MIKIMIRVRGKKIPSSNELAEKVKKRMEELKEESFDKLLKEQEKITIEMIVKDTLQLEKANSCMHSNGNCHVWFQKGNWEPSKLKHYYDSLCKVFTLNTDMAPIEYGSEEYKPVAPIMLKIDNNIGEIVFKHSPTVDVTMYFNQSITVSFKCDAYGVYKDILNGISVVADIYNIKERKTVYRCCKHTVLKYYQDQQSIICVKREDVPTFMKDILNPV